MGEAPWPDDDAAALRRFWLEDGLSATQIAARFRNRYSRNAVIGKIHRLGLKRAPASRAGKPARPKPAAPSVRRRLAPPQAPPAAVKAAPAPAPVALAAVAAPTPAPANLDARPWLSRGAAECAWPIDMAHGETFSCCAPVARGGYCAEHAAIAFRPQKTSPKELVRSLRRYA